MIGDFISLTILLFLALLISCIINVQASRALVPVLGCLELSAYIGGIFGNIFLGGIVGIGLLLLAFASYTVLRRGFIKVKIDAGFVFLIIMLILQILYHQYSVINNWDDWSHWAVQVKNIYLTGQFPCVSGNSCGDYLDYFPGIQILEALWLKTGNFYSDARLYIAYNMIVYVLFAGIISEIKKKWLAVMGMVAFVFSCNMFMPWQGQMLQTVTMDLYVGILLGYGFWLLYTKCNFLELVSVILLLCMSKQIGCLLALIILAIYIDGVLFKVERGKIAGIKIICLFIVEFGVVASWSFIKTKYGVYNNGEAVYTNLVQQGIHYFSSIEDWHIEGFKNFWIALFDYRIVDADYSTAFFFTPWVKVSTIWYVLIITVLLWMLTRNKGKYIAWANLFVLLGGVGYFAFISSLYLLNFSEPEIDCLSAFNRYIGTYLMAVLVLLYGLLFTTENVFSKGKGNLPWKKDDVGLVYFVATLLMLVVPNNTRYNFYYGLLSKSRMLERCNEYRTNLNKLNCAANLLDKMAETGTIVIDNADMVTQAEWNYYFYPHEVRRFAVIESLYESDEYLIVSSEYRSMDELQEFLGDNTKDKGVYRIIRNEGNIAFKNIEDVSWFWGN